MAEALAASDAALVRLRRLGDGWGQVQAMAPGVRALVAAGRAPEARARFEEIQALAPAQGMEEFAGLVIAGAAVHAGSFERALDRLPAADDQSDHALLLGGLDVLAVRTLALLMAVAFDKPSSVPTNSSPARSAVALAVAALVFSVNDRVDRAGELVRRRPERERDVSRPGLRLDRLRSSGAGPTSGPPAAIESGRLVAESTDDVVAIALIHEARRRLATGPESGEPAFELLGWSRGLDQCFGVVPARNDSATAEAPPADTA
ncbi:MAG: hypothetical protein R2715_04490 [Ilumatobacteraceae bacterium]